MTSNATTIEEQILTMLGEYSKDVSKSSKMDSLGLDSLEFLQLIVDIDDSLHVKLPIDRVVACETVNDLIYLVLNNL